MKATITLPYSEFANLLRGPLDCAGDDADVPALANVHLLVSDGRVTATATDRYRAMRTRTPENAEGASITGECEVLLPAAQLRHALKMLRPPARLSELSQVTVSIDGEAATIAGQAWLAGRPTGVMLTLDPADADKWPDLEFLFAEWSMEGRVLNATLLKRSLASVPPNETVVIADGERSKPVRIEIGGDSGARLVIMPMRWGSR